MEPAKKKPVGRQMKETEKGKEGELEKKIPEGQAEEKKQSEIRNSKHKKTGGETSRTESYRQKKK